MQRAVVILLLLHSIHLFSQPQYPPFHHGIASGDPLADRVILWTRVTPTDPAQQVTVNWRIAFDSAFNNIIKSGSFIADSSRDFTVKVDATGLNPGTTYYYDFETAGSRSATGRTKTAPVGNNSNVRFAVATCAKYSKGYFNAYARIGDRDDIDAVIHLGDYIYESSDSGEVGRVMLPYARCSTLTQFRERYTQYHTDPDLQHARARHPFINVWDDHETGNDSWMYGAQHFTDSAVFVPIKQAGMKVFFEWVPIRENPTYPNRIYRSFQYGDMADLIMLDTRLEGRMMQLIFEPANTAAINDTNRTILGHEQYNWLIQQLDNSTARWRVIGQQVMMAPALFFGQPINEDQWDNYPAERTKLYNHLETQSMKNVVVLTGDVHAALANDLPKDPSQYTDATGAGSAAVEFITPAIASSQSGFALDFSIVKSNNPHIQYAEFDKNGYMILDLSQDKAQGDFYFIPTTDTPGNSEELGASLYTVHGTGYFNKTPSSVSDAAESTRTSILIFPNPATDDEVTVELKYAPAGKVTFKIYDMRGKQVKTEAVLVPASGDMRFPLGISGWSDGMYLLKAFSGSKEFYSAKFAVAR